MAKKFVAETHPKVRYRIRRSERVGALLDNQKMQQEDNRVPGCQAGEEVL